MKDTNEIAHELLNTFGSLSAVLDAEIDELFKVKNMTKRAAIALNSIPYIIKRYLNCKAKPKKNLSTIINAVNYIRSETKFLAVERLIILCLDTHYNLIKAEIVKSDLPDRVNVSIKDIHAAVNRHRTKHVILAHNHPGGSVLPSDEDIALTKDVIISMSYIDIDVLDHIIVTEEKYFSFRERGLLYEFTTESKRSARVAAEKNNTGVHDES
jgi:DNA repair protein RadC